MGDLSYVRGAIFAGITKQVSLDQFPIILLFFVWVNYLLHAYQQSAQSDLLW
jgi:hypothetical protein